jgi:fructokinase
MKTVVAFGETLWDLLPSGPVLGGAPCNFAYRVNSLGDRGLLVTRLGRDELGRKAFQSLQDLGMDTALVQRDDVRPTGTVPVTIDVRGVPDFTIVKDVAYDYIAPSTVEGVDAVCFGTLVQRAPASREALSRLLGDHPVALKFCDINLRKDCFTRETIEASLDWSDILKLNEDELGHLGRLFGLQGRDVESLARQIADRWYLEACVVTLGERGVLAVSEDERVEIPGRKVEVVDTIGSGDAFSAAFVHLWLRERPLQECCFFGNALGAMVARTAGATAPIPVDEINAFCGRTIGT